MNLLPQGRSFCDLTKDPPSVFECQSDHVHIVAIIIIPLRLRVKIDVIFALPFFLKDRSSFIVALTHLVYLQQRRLNLSQVLLYVCVQLENTSVVATDWRQFCREEI